MRILVRHETTHRFGEPVRFAIQNLLMTPRNCGCQHVRRWRIEVDKDFPLLEREDAFGNILNSLSIDGPLSSLTILVEGEVETFDTAGVVTGAVERFPPALYLRETPLTTADTALRDFADAVAAGETTTLGRLHELNRRVNGAMRFEESPTRGEAGAAAAFSRKSGARPEFAHVFIAAARHMGTPARYVGGYLCGEDGADRTSGHSWAEALVDGLGWVGFDPTDVDARGESFVRVAIGLDHLGAAPMRTARTGGDAETLEVKLRVESASLQSQD